MTDAPAPTEPSPRLLLAWLALVAISLSVIHFSGPPNLTQNNEDRMAGYVYDAVENGNWICPIEFDGDLVSKPPLCIWISAAAASLVGKITPATLYLPSTLAVLFLPWILLWAGRRHFGWRTGFLAGLVYLLSVISEKQLATCRYDPLFTLTVALAALAAFRAWTIGKGWLWFWLAAAAATLTKGPLGVLLGGAGLLAAFWEWRTHGKAPVRGSHWGGVGLFFLITGGWFALAYWQRGDALVHKMLVKELVQQAVADSGAAPLKGLYEAPIAFLTALLPWSPLTLVAIWKVFTKPSQSERERRFERFLCCWLLAGLFIFALASHQRGRLLMPLFPAAALLTGREVARWFAGRTARHIFRTAAATTVLGLVIYAIFIFGITPRMRHTRSTAGMLELALDVNRRAGRQFPLTQMRAPYAFQYFRGSLYPFVTPEHAAELLSGDTPVFVSVINLEGLRKRTSLGERPLYVLARWPATGEPDLEIVSNQPRLEWTDPLVMAVEPFEIRMSGVRAVEVKGRQWIFRGGRQPKPQPNVEIINRSEQPEKVEVVIGPGSKQTRVSRILAPGETWTATPLPNAAQP